MKQVINLLYIHIPFCNKICTYCDFTRYLKPKNSVSIFDNYLNDLFKELDSYLNKYEFSLKSIYIGGGTPNILNNVQLEKLLKKLTIFSPIEFTIELNPELVNKKQLTLLKKYNVNRLSVGVQTSNSKILKVLKREHTNIDVINTMKWARELNFNNISIDLIYNLPFQKLSDIENDFKLIEQIKPDHISWYSLILKENSILTKKGYQLNNFTDYEYDILINKKLKTMAYDRYEISNYSKGNKKSLHNMGYWHSDNWLALGSGASSFIGNELRNNNKKINYLKHAYEATFLSKKDYYFQILMMGLRLIDGIEIINKNKLAFNFYKEKINKLISDKKLIYKNNILKANDINHLNTILVDIL